MRRIVFGQTMRPSWAETKALVGWVSDGGSLALEAASAGA